SDPQLSLQPISSDQNALIQNYCGRIGGKKSTFISKIDHGEVVRPGQIPWAAAMEMIDATRACTASLISSRHALTAAHCVLDMEKCGECSGKGERSEECDRWPNAEKTSNPSKWTIAYGGHCNTRVGVRTVAWDERYASLCQKFDMAIVEFEEEIKFDYKFESVAPICLADSSFEFKRSYATFFGFGFVQDGEKVFDRSLYSQLRYGVAIHTYTRPEGDEMYTLVHIVPFYCPFYMHMYINISVIQGDSGGGVYTTACDGASVLIGTISRSAAETTQSYASVLRTHIDEICNITGVCPKARC
ncbi:hypothetical protein PMAYCL1PPCAC_19648, partial [Pristionchus mayeri]